jgi:hypothetical protein
VVLINAGATENSQKHAFRGNPAPGGNPGLKCTLVGAIFKSFCMQTILIKIKNKPNPENFKLRLSTQYNETICRPPQSRETIPLRTRELKKSDPDLGFSALR